jgi:thioredoxin reductase (NADPH)
VDDLLEDWWQEFKPTFRGIRVIGHRWSPDSHVLRDFLARNLVPYQWLDVERDAEATRALVLATVDTSKLPVVLLEDGGLLVQPSSPGRPAAGLALHRAAVHRPMPQSWARRKRDGPP